MPAPGVRDGKTILFVGKEWERKGGPLLLNAFQSVRELVPDARLAVVGPTAPRAEVANVDWLGAVPDREQLMRLYADSSIFVMPSYCEPFGLVFLEAMANELPCVGTEIDAIPEIILDGETGLLVPAGDAEKLAWALLRLIQEPARAVEMGVAGSRRLMHSFGWAMLATSSISNCGRYWPERLPSHEAARSPRAF